MSGQNEDLYEVLQYDASVELLDTEGRLAVYEKRERVRFLRDGVEAFPDFGWGTGIAFATHDVEPGSLVDRRLTGTRLRSVVQLPRPYQKGEELTFAIDRTVKSGFISPQECWLDADVYHRVRGRLSLKATLPPGRPVKRAWLIRLHEAGGRRLRVERLADGRQCISHTVRHPELNQRYTLFWEW